MLDFVAPKKAEVVSGRKIIRTAAKSAGRKTLRKRWGGGSRNNICKLSQSVAKIHFYKHFSLITSNNFRYKHFVAVSGNLGGKVPVIDDVLSSHEHHIYLTKSRDKNCIEFEFPVDQNYYDDLRRTYLALKLKIVEGRGYETYKGNEVKKEHKAEAKVAVETEEDEAPVPLVTHVNNILHSVSSNVDVYINNQQIYKANGSHAHKPYISNNFKGAIFEYKEVLDCKGMTMKNFLTKLWNRFYLNLISQREWNA